ncbi:MAG: NAD(P)/FAD-dependent oxidoreductase [Alphaproteobacteria bacterium]
MAHIVILGGGIGGVSMAYDMRALCLRKSEHKITIISDSPSFHFVPSNPWVGVGWTTRRKIEVPLEKYLKRKNIDFIPVAAKKVHPHENYIELINGQNIAYDYLVIATGPRLAFEHISGLGPHNGFTQSVCHVDHAEKAAEKWAEFKQNPGPIVVGAVQESSCFGPAYEHAFIMHHDLAKTGLRSKVPMTFVTPEPYIGHLGLGGVGDSKTLLESELRKRDIKWLCNAMVEKVESNIMHVIEYDDLGNKKQKHTLPFHYSMMLPAFRGVDAITDIEGLVNERGYVLVDEYQRNPAYKNIFAVGVCVAIPPLEETPVQVCMPKTGYMIESMVAATGHNIIDLCQGKEPSHIPTLSAICIADMGNTGIVFVAQPQIPPRNVAWMKGGKWAHWLKIVFEWYFLWKVKTGSISPFYEKYALRLMGIRKRE